MFTINCIPKSFSCKFPEGTPVHALFAAFFTNGDAEDLQKYDIWRKTWPRREDFEGSMPIIWAESLRGLKPDQTLLPPSISGTWNTFQKRKAECSYDSSHQNLLPKQEKRLQDAWERVIFVFPETDWETFSYHWLIVNTRSFHYLMPGEEPPEDRNDAMALLPFADYFNHSDVIVRYTPSCCSWWVLTDLWYRIMWNSMARNMSFELRAIMVLTPIFVAPDRS